LFLDEANNSPLWTCNAVLALAVLLYDGTRLTVGPTSASEVDRRAALPGTERAAGGVPSLNESLTNPGTCTHELNGHR
jgi:hypothetical protein